MVENGAQAIGITVALRGLSSKGHSTMCGSFIKSGLRQEEVHQEPPGTDVSRTWANTTIAIPKARELVCCSVVCYSFLFGNQGPSVWKNIIEMHRIQVAWSPLWSFNSLWRFGEPSSSGVGPLNGPTPEDGCNSMQPSYLSRRRWEPCWNFAMQASWRPLSMQPGLP